MIWSSAFLGVALLSVGLGELPNAPTVTPPPEKCNWCTSNEHGTKHSTLTSSGVGISDPSTHGWITGTCGEHHTVGGCATVSIPNELLDQLEEESAAGDWSALRAAVASAPPGTMSLDEAQGRLNVFGCGGRLAAVLWVHTGNVANGGS